MPTTTVTQSLLTQLNSGQMDLEEFLFLNKGVSQVTTGQVVNLPQKYATSSAQYSQAGAQARNQTTVQQAQTKTQNQSTAGRQHVTQRQQRDTAVDGLTGGNVPPRPSGEAVMLNDEMLGENRIVRDLNNALWGVPQTIGRGMNTIFNTVLSYLPFVPPEDQAAMRQAAGLISQEKPTASRRGYMQLDTEEKFGATMYDYLRWAAVGLAKPPLSIQFETAAEVFGSQEAAQTNLPAMGYVWDEAAGMWRYVGSESSGSSAQTPNTAFYQYTSPSSPSSGGSGYSSSGSGSRGYSQGYDGFGLVNWRVATG